MVWKFAPKWPLKATVKAFRNRCQSRWRINVPATAVYSVDKAERGGQVRAMVVPFSSLAPLWSILSTLLLSSKVDIMVPGVGRLRGSTIRSTESRRPIHSFWGVPYAEPPTHSLRFDGWQLENEKTVSFRFAPPQPRRPLNNGRPAFDASLLRFIRSPPRCPQVR